MFEKGFTSQHKELGRTKLDVSSKLPHWLEGELFCNGPGQLECARRRRGG